MSIAFDNIFFRVLRGLKFTGLVHVGAIEGKYGGRGESWALDRERHTGGCGKIGTADPSLRSG